MVMKALPSLDRNIVIRAVALMSVVAFPLIVDVQFGLGSRAAQIPQDVSPANSDTAQTTTAGRHSCSDEHWPFFSKACLRASPQAIEPRLVSMNEQSPPNSAATNASIRVAAAAATAHGKVPAAKAKKAKPRIVTHMRERKNVTVRYAVNSQTTPVSQASQMSAAGW
jgi:hypothetical protein